MTKKILLLVITVLLCVSLVTPALAKNDGRFLLDSADILTAAEESDLYEKLERISYEYGVDVAVVTVDGTSGLYIDTFTEKYFDKSGLGQGTDRDGVLFLVDMDEREFRFLSNGRDLGAAAISEDTIELLTSLVSDDLLEGNYAKAFHTYADECEYQINGYINGFPFNFGLNLIISLVIGFVISLIVTLIMKGKLKSVKRQTAAANYIKRGSFVINVSNDTFLYSHVTKVRRSSSNGSGGRSSPSRNIGGGSF
ncbi:MAG: TPM domain-containing protein [Clostridia bacterium]|nr:TPM domain-containing protein [Clostridia bacterium]